jgi:hypothetical protein
VVSIQLPTICRRAPGKRLFADSGPAIKLAFAGSETDSNGALRLTCRPAAQGGRAWPWYAHIGGIPERCQNGHDWGPR